MREVDLCGAFRKIGHWNFDQLNVCCESDLNVEIDMGYVTWNATVISRCEERKLGFFC